MDVGPSRDDRAHLQGLTAEVWLQGVAFGLGAGTILSLLTGDTGLDRGPLIPDPKGRSSRSYLLPPVSPLLSGSGT